MKTPARFALLLSVLLSSVVPAPAALVLGGDYLLTPRDGGEVVVWDTNLVESSRFTVAGIDSVTGSVCNDRGNLVMIARRNNQVEVVEADLTGAFIRSYATGRFSLLRGSYIDFDPATRRYVFADDDRLTLLDADLGLVASSSPLFDRASGVAFGSDGFIYATDQFESLIHRFTPGLALVESIPFSGWINTGIDASPDGSLLVSMFGDGAVDRFDPDTRARQNVVSGLGYGRVSTVLELPDGSILTAGTSLQLRSAGGSLLHTAAFSGDSVALWQIPEPGVPALAAAGVVLALAGRRPRRATPAR